MTTTNVRFHGLVQTTSALNTDRFIGRIGYDSTKARWVVSPDGSTWAESARRDVAETFAVSITSPSIIASTSLRIASLNGLLAQTSGGNVRVATASDLPSHASRHENGGSDALTGQNISGLMVTSTPIFAGQSLRTVGSLSDLSYQHTDGTRRFFLRWDNTNDRWDATTANDDGSPRTTRIRIPRSDSSPVAAYLGFNLASGDHQVGGVGTILSTREGRFTGLRLSNLSSGQIPVASDGNGQITASGQTDDGTFLTSTRTLRLWNSMARSGNTWTDLQWTQDAQQRVSTLGSNGSGGNAYHILTFVPTDTEAANRDLGYISYGQKVSGKSGGSPGIKIDTFGRAVGAGGSVGGYGGQWGINYRPDNGPALLPALRVGAFGGGTADAVEAAILLRANADFLANYAKIQKDADASVGLDVVGPSGTGKFRMINTGGGSVLGINAGSLEISCANGVGIGTASGNASILVSTGDVSVAKTFFSSTHKELPTERTGSASTAIGDRIVVYKGTTNQTESLPAATGSNRIITFVHATNAGTWTLDAAGTDEIAGELQANVGSIAILANSAIKNRTLMDYANGLWVVI